MDKLFDSLQDSSGERSLYNDLAPLYDFMYDKHYDYTNQYDLVSDLAPAGTQQILEGACGTGRLANLLVEEFGVVGVDLNDGMLSIAESRVPEARFIHQDFTQMELDNTFGLFCIFGGSIVYVKTTHDFQNLAETAYDSLSSDGVFAFDFFPRHTLNNGESGENIFVGDEYRVTRNHVTTQSDTDLFCFNFGFEIEQTSTGETVTTGTTEKIRGYRREELREILSETGFSQVTHRSPDPWADGAGLADLIIAEK